MVTNTGTNFYKKARGASVHVSGPLSINSRASKKEKFVTQEDKDKFVQELSQARGRIEFPVNPSLFPQAIRIQQLNEKKAEQHRKEEVERLKKERVIQKREQARQI